MEDADAGLFKVGGERVGAAAVAERKEFLEFGEAVDAGWGCDETTFE